VPCENMQSCIHILPEIDLVDELMTVSYITSNFEKQIVLRALNGHVYSCALIPVSEARFRVSKLGIYTHCVFCRKKHIL